MNTTRPTRLYFLRHGEVEVPYQRVFGGRLDIGLSAEGLRQAEELAASLQGIHFAGVYASPMKRVQQTLAPLLASNGYRPVWLDGLREVDFGQWTGHTWEEVRERFARSAFDWLTELDRGGIPGAEGVPEFRQRVAGCLEEIRARHPGENVAVACHGGVVRMALAHLLDLPLPKMAHFEIDYASLTVVDDRPHRTEVQLLNFAPWRGRP